MKQLRLISILFYFCIESIFATVSHIPISGTIDMGLPYFIDRSIAEAESSSSDVIIFEIDTFGGRIDAATQIKDLILDTSIPTIAFINKRAISAGALISLSCDSIFMTEGATIGAATAVDLEGKKASEKVLSYMREEMASTAEVHNRSREIAEAMVDEDIEISFMLNLVGDTLTSAEVEGFNKGKLITLSTQNAIQLGIANGEFNSLDNILKHVELEHEKVVSNTETWSEILVRFLTNPNVAPLLMSLGMLGLFFEVKSPGFGIPGILGLLCLGLFFGAHLLVGLADMVDFLILFAGLFFIVLEITVIPGFGVAGITGLSLFLFALFRMLLGEYPTYDDYQSAYKGVSIGIVSSILSGIILFKALIKTKMYNRIIPITSQKSEEGFTISKGYEELIGKHGVAVTNLRPGGKILIYDSEYQAMSHGNFIEKDTPVIVDSVDENQLVVSKKLNK
jgi:membrane-bound serine protease (ClpP class)